MSQNDESRPYWHRCARRNGRDHLRHLRNSIEVKAPRHPWQAPLHREVPKQNSVRVCTESALPLQQVPKMPLTSARAGSGAVLWERQSHPSRENWSLPNRIKNSNCEGILRGGVGGKAPLYFHCCSWSPLMRQRWLWNSKSVPVSDRAGRLRHSYFIARAVVLFFKIPEYFWIAKQNWQG